MFTAWTSANKYHFDARHIRISGDVNYSAPAVRGDSWQTEVCIRVSWPWLSCPAVLLLATIVLLCSTIVHTMQHAAQPIWKSSPLPLLFHGLGGELREQALNVYATEQMEQTSKDWQVRLSNVGSGLQFNVGRGVR